MFGAYFCPVAPIKIFQHFFLARQAIYFCNIYFTSSILLTINDGPAFNDRPAQLLLDLLGAVVTE